jgi:predicted HicB family RNase H-like nuclease
MKKYIETDGCMMASATDKQKDSLKEYMKKIKDIKLRVPEEYLQPIKEHAKAKGMSVNQLVISLLEKDMGIEIVTVREQNKQNKENENE